jgi:hypothetical protein
MRSSFGVEVNRNNMNDSNDGIYEDIFCWCGGSGSGGWDRGEHSNYYYYYIKVVFAVVLQCYKPKSRNQTQLEKLS